MNIDFIFYLPIGVKNFCLFRQFSILASFIDFSQWRSGQLRGEFSGWARPIKPSMTTPSCLVKITVKGTPNLIWRRFVVPIDISLDRLHGVIQTVMGWQGTRPHSFEVRKQKFAPAGSEVENALPETNFTLANLASRSRTRLKYRYGDWDHDIVVESIRYANPVWPFPSYCLEGVRRCPPESCSNMDEFVEYLKTVNELDHFDLAAVNKVFGVDGPIDVPSIKPSPKKRPVRKRPDPLQRLGRLMKLAVSQADGM